MSTIEKFANCCAISLCGNILKVDAKIRNQDGKIYRFSKSVDLTPIARKIILAITKYHKHLHGNISVSGWKNIVKRSVKAARKVAENSAVKSLYGKASPFLSTIPGGNTLTLVTKAHDVLVAARSGDQKALDKLKKISNSRDPKAKYVLSKLRAMNTILETRQDETVGWNPLSKFRKKIRKATKFATPFAKFATPFVPGASAAVATATMVRNIKRRKPNNRQNQKPLIPPPNLPSQQPNLQYDGDNEYEAGEGETGEGDCGDYENCEDVGGWVNTPYRNYTQMIFEPNARNLYNRGIH